ncbi:unnamed protein product [Closterium sp. NIES-64]|nr:unnamed protein product [Closterium sp. NIES-64]
MGALNSNLVTNYHQGWRLVTAMWLHGGVVHLVCNLLGIAFLLNRLEKEFGLYGKDGGEGCEKGHGMKLCAAWCVSHLVCNLLGIAFLLNRLEKEFGLCTCVVQCGGMGGGRGNVGEGGWRGEVNGRPTAIYLLSGVFAAVFPSCLFLNTQARPRPATLMTLIILLIAINLAIYVMPYIDNSWSPSAPPSLLPLPPSLSPCAPLLSSLCPPSLLLCPHTLPCSSQP